MTQTQPTLLIVDDEVINLNILADAFKQQYKLLVTKSGAQGLMRAMHHDVDLILLDIMLPDMDGFEVCKRLKQNEKTRDIPVLFITSKKADSDEELGLQVGAADYIYKPFYLPLVQARVETHLALKRKTCLLEKLASLDGRTCLPNRHKFGDCYAIEYKRAQRDDTPLCLAVIDIDHFKHYNDNYGHNAGDRILRQVADFLSCALEHSYDLVARIGSDEFVLLLPNTSAEKGAALCRRILAELAERQWQHLYSPNSQYLTFSIGGTTYTSETSLEADEVFAKAEHALNKAICDGRNKVVWFV